MLFDQIRNGFPTFEWLWWEQACLWYCNSVTCFPSCELSICAGITSFVSVSLSHLLLLLERIVHAAQSHELTSNRSNWHSWKISISEGDGYCEGIPIVVSSCTVVFCIPNAIWTCVSSYWMAWYSQHYPGLPLSTAVPWLQMYCQWDAVGWGTHLRSVFVPPATTAVVLIRLVIYLFCGKAGLLHTTELVIHCGCHQLPPVPTADAKRTDYACFSRLCRPPHSPRPWGFWVISSNNMAEATPHSAAVMSIYLRSNPPLYPMVERGQCESNFSLTLLNTAGARLFEHSPVCLLMRETTPGMVNPLSFPQVYCICSKRVQGVQWAASDHNI